MSEVLLDQGHLLAERLVGGAGVEHMPQQRAEAGNEPDDARVVACPCERRDAVERVEEEVRLQLRAERLETRGRELRLEPGGGDLPLAVSLVQRQRLTHAGDRGVNQDLHVHAPAKLADDDGEDRDGLGCERHGDGHDREVLHETDGHRQREVRQDATRPSHHIRQPVSREPPDHERVRESRPGNTSPAS